MGEAEVVMGMGGEVTGCQGGRGRVGGGPDTPLLALPSGFAWVGLPPHLLGLLAL